MARDRGAQRRPLKPSPVEQWERPMPKRKRPSTASEEELAGWREAAAVALIEADHPKALRSLDKLVAAGERSTQILFMRWSTSD